MADKKMIIMMKGEQDELNTFLPATTSEMVVHNGSTVKNKLTEIDGRLEGVVNSVNGIEPDENGNVEIDTDNLIIEKLPTGTSSKGYPDGLSIFYATDTFNEWKSLLLAQYPNIPYINDIEQIIVETHAGIPYSPTNTTSPPNIIQNIKGYYRVGKKQIISVQRVTTSPPIARWEWASLLFPHNINGTYVSDDGKYTIVNTTSVNSIEPDEAGNIVLEAKDVDTKFTKTENVPVDYALPEEVWSFEEMIRLDNPATRSYIARFIATSKDGYGYDHYAVVKIIDPNNHDIVYPILIAGDTPFELTIGNTTPYPEVYTTPFNMFDIGYQSGEDGILYYKTAYGDEGDFVLSGVIGEYTASDLIVYDEVTTILNVDEKFDELEAKIQTLLQMLENR